MKAIGLNLSSGCSVADKAPKWPRMQFNHDNQPGWLLHASDFIALFGFCIVYYLSRNTRFVSVDCWLHCFVPLSWSIHTSSRRIVACSQLSLVSKPQYNFCFRQLIDVPPWFVLLLCQWCKFLCLVDCWLLLRFLCFNLTKFLYNTYPQIFAISFVNDGGWLLHLFDVLHTA